MHNNASNRQSPRILRNNARTARKNITPEFRQYAAQRVCDLLLTDAVFLRSTHIASYIAADGELSPSKIVQAVENRGKQNFLPLVSDFIRPWEPMKLMFQPYNSRDDALVPNRYGIPEPPYAPQCTRSPAMLDLVIMPLVAFDLQLNRLGMGKGYYDRTFGKSLRWKRLKLLGLAFASQQVEQLESKILDVPLDGVLTEEGISWRSYSGEKRAEKA